MSGLKAQRVGLFGGAFDPPHRAHVALAQAAIEQLNLDVLHVVPTGHAWHKQRTLTEARHRLAMCHLAFANVYRALVDDREIMRSGPTYTIDTLRELQAIYPQAQLYLVMGEDQAKALPSWHRVEELGGTAIICVASRSDSNAATAMSSGGSALRGAVFQPVQMPPSPLSATEIRDKSARGQSVAPLVFESVARYIDQHHLYQSA
ncbi:nicotinate (nicotinamide) nucleotide adenylyltransferase [Rhodoferax sp. GW822-FHT02A01]|uniref:nicotinate (nicotinamide) nucleotide adenylyltransferase n=1 Tax=Rhodoferax sp. GW822-FHT02A01 TaxID=3141537 RepID=UPI00315CFD6A